VAKAVLRHRLVVNFQAEADGIPTESLIEMPK
jgi:MoxR-like ATPase